MVYFEFKRLADVIVLPLAIALYPGLCAAYPLALEMQGMAILPVLAFHYELADIHTDCTTTLQRLTAPLYGLLGTSLLLHQQVKLL